MMTRFLVLFALTLFLLTSQAAYADDLPTELFGLELGMTTTRTPDNPSGEMAVKKLTGIRPWNRGARYYYEPSAAFEGFPFLDYRQGIETSYGTNFYSIVFPIIPDQVNTVSEWESHAKEHGEDFKVLTIEYTSDDFDSERSAYLAASEMCTDKRVDLFREPLSEVDTVDAEKNSYRRTCIFAQDNRELEISQFGPKFVYRLKYSDEYILATNQAIEEKLEAMRNNAEGLEENAEGLEESAEGSLEKSQAMETPVS